MYNSVILSIFSLFFIIVFSSCDPIYRIYVRNYSDNDVKVIVNHGNSIVDLEEITSVDTIISETIKYYQSGKIHSSVMYSVKDSGTYIINVPSKSTSNVIPRMYSFSRFNYFSVNGDTIRLDKESFLGGKGERPGLIKMKGWYRYAYDFK